VVEEVPEKYIKNGRVVGGGIKEGGQYLDEAV
jgi:hypothetical protein